MIKERDEKFLSAGGDISFIKKTGIRVEEWKRLIQNWSQRSALVESILRDADVCRES